VGKNGYVIFSTMGSYILLWAHQFVFPIKINDEEGGRGIVTGKV